MPRTQVHMMIIEQAGQQQAAPKPPSNDLDEIGGEKGDDRLIRNTPAKASELSSNGHFHIFQTTTKEIDGGDDHRAGDGDAVGRGQVRPIVRKNRITSARTPINSMAVDPRECRSALPAFPTCAGSASEAAGRAGSPGAPANRLR